eukprot:4122697-Pleurochrysis_carterae.AAC.1
MPCSSPQSAGCSSAHATPARCASSAASRAKWARVLCFCKYRRQRFGAGSMPSGDALERSCG